MYIAYYELESSRRNAGVPYWISAMIILERLLWALHFSGHYVSLAITLLWPLLFSRANSTLLSLPQYTIE
jgi:hypothetical protein